jgi:hypothetical protein
MKVEVLQKTQYGIFRFYPTNELAKKFADFAGRMTFDAGHLKRIKDMGVEVEIKHEAVQI